MIKNKKVRLEKKLITNDILRGKKYKVKRDRLLLNIKKKRD